MAKAKSPEAEGTDGQKGREGQLSRDEIVETALRLARRVGVDNITMRSLAAELGVTPAAAYYYVKNKEDLLDLIADEVVSSVVDPATATGDDWEQEFRQAARDSARSVDAYPGLFGVLASRRFTKSARRSMDKLLADLMNDGFDERSAARAYGVYIAYLLGFCMLQDHAGKSGAFAFPTRVGGYPTLAQVSAATRDLTSADYLEFGMDTIIWGLRALGPDKSGADGNSKPKRAGGAGRRASGAGRLPPVGRPSSADASSTKRRRAKPA